MSENRYFLTAEIIEQLFQPHLYVELTDDEVSQKLNDNLEMMITRHLLEFDEALIISFKFSATAIIHFAKNSNGAFATMEVQPSANMLDTQKIAEKDNIFIPALLMLLKLKIDALKHHPVSNLEVTIQTWKNYYKSLQVSRRK